LKVFDFLCAKLQKSRNFSLPLQSKMQQGIKTVAYGDRQYPSQLLEKAVEEFSKLPGIGRKTALRLVLHLLRRDTDEVEQFTEAVNRMKHEVKYCRCCHNISDTELCPICADPRRDTSLICVVENIQDVMAIENTQQYHGLYHVLGGIISPMEGVGPSDLEIDSLVKRVEAGGVEEVIFALSSTMEGDTTNFYISRKLAVYPVKLSVIARGISVGDELEYTDEVTLGRSILNRTPFNG
jgi:recombination protein RecR